MFESNWKSALLLNIYDKSNLHFILLFKKLSIRSSHLWCVLFNGDDWMGIKSVLDELIEEDAEIEWPQVTLFSYIPKLR